MGCGYKHAHQHRPTDSTPRLTQHLGITVQTARCGGRTPATVSGINDGIDGVLGACARQTNNNHEICECPRAQCVLCSIGSSVGSGEAATAHLSASETRVELEEVGVGSDLGQVPLHGALGVSR